jgi:VIT1/CCC1 family predicted Fe2+/Mn2+ transporter
MSFNPRNPRFVSTLVSDIEEGLVLTVGLLCGLAIAGISGATIVLAGTIFVVTGGVSAASRHFLSSAYATEPVEGSVSQAAIVLGLTYVVAGIIPLLPYMLMDVSRAFTTSIVCTFAAAFIIGLWSGHKGAAVWKSAWHMAYVGAAGSIIGAIAHSVL